MQPVKISYRKEWNKDGTVYKTHVKMDKETFAEFLKKLEIIRDDLKDNNKRFRTCSLYNLNCSCIGIINQVIEEYNNSSIKNTMYLTIQSTKILKIFLEQYNLNIKNRELIENVDIKIV